MRKSTSVQNALNLSVEEKMILHGIIANGKEQYCETVDILSEKTFDVFENKIIYGACKSLFDKGLDINATAVISTAKDMGLDKDNLLDILATPTPKLSEARSLANKLKNRAIIKESATLHRAAIDKLSQMSASESINEIIGVSEKALFDLISKFSNSNDDIIKMGNIARDLVKYWGENPAENVGLPTPWPRFNKSIGGGMRTGVTLIGARSGKGKAQPLDSLLLTPNGFIKMGNVKIGDILINPNNNHVTVTHIHPHPNKEVFKITFKNGDIVEACGDHIWQVEKNRSDYQNYEQLKTTKDLYEDQFFKDKRGGRKKWKIRLSSAVEFSKQDDLIIPPYSFGALIGDGSITNSIQITSADKELINYIQSELPTDYNINKLKNKYSWSITGVKQKNIWMDEIRNLKLDTTSHHKYIPKKYKYSTIEDRKELLRGLLDTDGHPTLYTTIEYSTASKELAEDVCFIARSLGGLAKYKLRYTKNNGKSFPSYRVILNFNDCSEYFKLNRKKNKVKKKTKYFNYHYISKIESIGLKDCQCITVSSDDGMYITNNFIKTHNSIIAQNTGVYLSNLGIPVLILDTEMEYKDVLPRILANISEVSINKIESGSFAQSDFEKKAVEGAVKQIEDSPLYYKTIAGKSFDEIMSTVRRWIYSTVGINKEGRANQCLVIYDYFKIMDAGDIGDMAEFQAMGFQISKLTDFCKTYDFPCLSFVQLNRDGVAKEGTDVIAQSDRLLWLCNSFSIFKEKSEEDMEAHGWNNGNRKLITLKSRYGGEAQSSKDHISMQFKGDISSLKEVIEKENNEQN